MTPNMKPWTLQAVNLNPLAALCPAHTDTHFVGVQPFNVLRYQLTQHYDSHYDVFDPESYGPQPSQRMATVLLYLSAPEEGGETVFPFEGEHGLDRLPTIDYRSCDVGLKVHSPYSVVRAE